jgi:YfiH family protein
LNLGGTVGDDPANVAENRRRAFECFGRPIGTLYDVWQVHSAEVVRADAPRPAHIPHLKADAILTDQPEVTLFMRFADCVPILLYDPVRRVMGMVHAGWKGTTLRIVQAAVQAMQRQWGTRPDEILAAIGPSIAPHHYTVGQDVITQVEAAFGQEANTLLPAQDGAVQFDLWTANRLVLMDSGVRQIEVSGVCTACDLEHWYSHRGEQGRTGRFGALMAL